ncbi:MAG: phosphate signaling complex protein PhoU [Synergistales bacterium]|nr:phosphate signaling complex protein PhoU [Synergistales bacterium]
MQPINTRKAFDESLKQLESDLLQLGNMAEDAFSKAIWALTKQDVQVAQEVIDGDDVLDDMNTRIDNECLQIIARYQPVALDLRRVSAAMHMAVDLERIGDLAVNISKSAKRLSGTTYIKRLLDIPRMSDHLRDMIDLALTAYVERDSDKAQRVCQMDDIIDDLHEQIFRELVVIMMEKPKTIEQATELLFVSRTIERAGDHATNLAEHTLYLTTGTMKRASDIRRPKPESEQQKEG